MLQDCCSRLRTQLTWCAVIHVATELELDEFERDRPARMEMVSEPNG